MILTGTKINGLGQARATIGLQKRKINLDLPAVKNTFSGTLNIQLEDKIVNTQPDYISPALKWRKELAAEVICLTALNIRFNENQEFIQGWLYESSASEHRFDLSLIEVLAPFIENATGICEIELGARASIQEIIVL